MPSNLSTYNNSYLKFNHGAGGLGDALLALCVLKPLQKVLQPYKIAFGVSPIAYNFIKLFDGYDALAYHEWDNNPDYIKANLIQINSDYLKECKTHCNLPRWQRYQRNIGIDLPPQIPQLKRPLPSQYKNYIILCPYSTWANREWRLESWLTLEKLLIDKGYKVLILGERTSKYFKSIQIVNESAERVTGIINSCDMLIGGDSGLVHLAGILNKPAVVICGQTTGKDIFCLYPSVKVVQGKLLCDGCWWNPESGYTPTRCDPTCASMQSILPTDILNLIDNELLPKFAGHKACVDSKRLIIIRDCIINNLFLSGVNAEFGVWQGGVSKLILNYDNSELHLFDTFEGIPEDDLDADGVHKKGDFNDTSLNDVKKLLGDNKNIIYHQGMFVGDGPDIKYKFVHLDFDTYQSTKCAIQYLKNKMVSGGCIVFDDFNWMHCPGVARAIYEEFGMHCNLQKSAEYQAVMYF